MVQIMLMIIKWGRMVLPFVGKALPYLIPALMAGWMVWSYMNTQDELQHLSTELVRSRKAVEQLEDEMSKRDEITDYQQRVNLALSEMERQLTSNTNTFSERMKEIANTHKNAVESGEQTDETLCTDSNSLNADVSGMLNQHLEAYR